MTTFFETIAHINSKEGSASKLITGTATYKTQSKKFIDFTYRLFPETAPEECENFNVGEVVFIAGKFCYDLATEKSAAGIVVCYDKQSTFISKNSRKMETVNFPQTRPLITFSAVCESKMSKIDFCITEYKNDEIKNLNMKSNIYGCMSHKDLPHFFSIAYKHNQLRWAHLNIQLNKRYFITGVLNRFIVENDPLLTRLVVCATEIDYDTFSAHTTTTNIFHNSATKNQIIVDDVSHDLTDTLIQSKRKRNVSFSEPNSPNNISKKPIKNQQMSITSVSSDDEENKSEIKEILPYPSTLTSQKSHPIITPIQNPMQQYHEPQTPQPNAFIIDETSEAPKSKQTRKKRTPTKKEVKQPVKKNNNVQGIATNQLFRNENNKRVPTLTKDMSEVEEIMDTSDVE
ncbi:hypothetical protein Glove_851g22 [Diversispora epigaea]|uniref:Uncharacterized protein n=1 Tax=Diversispora epigaea TaxID=1348612 RepID=A0A397FYJ9_9GLOM|nr:hypothetical protein Glove_851g22 [Diversispora epigaea]